MHFKRFGIVLLLLVVFVLGGLFFSKPTQKDTASPPIALPSPQSLPRDPHPRDPPPIIPEQVLLSVPFTAQAPTGHWDDFHNETCEEASAIMAAAYLAGDTRQTLPAAETEKQLIALALWENQHLGNGRDTTAAETAEMIRSVYHLHTDLTNDFSERDIRTALVAGKLIIVPLSGRSLGNPYFRHPGPLYHMLVIRGYTQSTLITNDPGTKHGENYPYPFTTIKNASADWNHTTGAADPTRSVMLVVSK